MHRVPQSWNRARFYVGATVTDVVMVRWKEDKMKWKEGDKTFSANSGHAATGRQRDPSDRRSRESLKPGPASCFLLGLRYCFISICDESLMVVSHSGPALTRRCQVLDYQTGQDIVDENHSLRLGWLSDTILSLHRIESLWCPERAPRLSSFLLLYNIYTW
jgi:hypothetical protein